MVRQEPSYDSLWQATSQSAPQPSNPNWSTDMRCLTQKNISSYTHVLRSPHACRLCTRPPICRRRRAAAPRRPRHEPDPHRGGHRLRLLPGRRSVRRPARDADVGGDWPLPPGSGPAAGPPHYRRRFDEVLDFLDSYTPTVEDGELGTAYLSLDSLSVEPQSFAEELISSLHRRLGFMASVGIAGGKFPARVVAQTTRPGLAKVVPPGDEAVFLVPLPVDHFPASDTMRWRLRLLGLDTIGDIGRLPLGAFQQQFGPEGKRCWELANGIDNEPLVSRIKEETVVRRLQFPAPVVSLDAILMGVERLVHAAYATPDRLGHWVRGSPSRSTISLSAIVCGPSSLELGFLRGSTRWPTRLRPRIYTTTRDDKLGSKFR
jgi:hypothetical protein